VVGAQHIQHLFWCFPRFALQLEIHSNTCIEDGIPLRCEGTTHKIAFCRILILSLCFSMTFRDIESCPI